jgi:hypothetical protein
MDIRLELRYNSRMEKQDGGNRSLAKAIAVSGSDVYVAGYEYNAVGEEVACYWKNGVRTALSDGTRRAEAKAIVLVGGFNYECTD